MGMIDKQTDWIDLQIVRTNEVKDVSGSLNFIRFFPLPRGGRGRETSEFRAL